MCWGNSDTNIWGVTNHSLVGCEAHSEREAMPGTASVFKSLRLDNSQASGNPKIIVLLKKHGSKMTPNDISYTQSVGSLSHQRIFFMQ